MLLEEPTGQILPGVLSALESYLVTVFNEGAKYIPSLDQAFGFSPSSFLSTMKACHVDYNLSGI